ncbi:Hok/Gef family protein [Serratia marcescens]|nr:Hok/Gef family protein [Serratia marcescens]MDK1706996.1 Hok/Gef family protein [Serratia marcescens]
MLFRLLTTTVICIAIVVFAWLERGSLCELSFRLGDMEVAAHLHYEGKS